MLQSQRQERDDLLSEADELEAKEFKNLHKELESERKRELEEEQEKLQGKLLAAQVSEKDVDRMMRLHHQQVEEHQRKSFATMAVRNNFCHYDICFNHTPSQVPGGGSFCINPTFLPTSVSRNLRLRRIFPTLEFNFRARLKVTVCLSIISSCIHL